MVRGATPEELLAAELGQLVIPAVLNKNLRAVSLRGADIASLQEAFLAKAEEAARIDGSDQVLLICATPQAAADLVFRLKDSGSLLASAAVACPREIALEVLSADGASQVTGRHFATGKARVLSAFEEDILFEDLKSLGTRPKRLRELLKFIRRGWADLADESPGWLVTVEEQDVLAILCEELEYLGGVLKSELVNLAFKVLCSCPDICNAFTKKHVFVFEYQNLSRASQMLCNLLAKESITILSNLAACAEVFEEYPYEMGPEEFLRIYEGVEQIALPSSRQKSSQEYCCKNPQEEAEQIAAQVKNLIEKGCAPHEIAIGCFTVESFRRVARGLRRSNIPVCGMFKPFALQGDFLDYASALPLRIVTALRLLACPQDAIAWRTWFGFGKHLAQSNKFSVTRDAWNRGESDVSFADEVQAWEGYEAVANLLEYVRDMRGEELLDTLFHVLAPEIPDFPQSIEFLRGLGAGADAACMVRALEERELFCSFAPRAGVTLGTLSALSGQPFAEVILAGFVNGALPTREYFDLTEITIEKQTRMALRDERIIAYWAALPKNNLTISSFTAIPEVNAKKEKLQVDRIFVDNDRNTQAQVSTSIYAETLKDFVNIPSKKKEAEVYAK